MKETEYSSTLLRRFNMESDKCWFFKIPPFIKGLPDIFGCYEGKTVFIETKMEGGTLSQTQMIYLNRIHSIGGLSLVICGFIRSGQLFHLIHKWPIVSPVIIMPDTQQFKFNNILAGTNYLTQHLYTHHDKIELFDQYLQTTCNFRMNRLPQNVDHSSNVDSIYYLSGPNG